VSVGQAVVDVEGDGEAAVRVAVGIEVNPLGVFAGLLGHPRFLGVADGGDLGGVVGPVGRPAAGRGAVAGVAVHGVKAQVLFGVRVRVDRVDEPHLLLGQKSTVHAH